MELTWTRFAFSVILMGSALLPAQEAESPFVPPSQKVEPKAQPKTTPATPLDSVEFRGVTEIGGIAWVSLYDTKSKKSYRLSQEVDWEDGFQLVRYDRGSKPGEETIVVRQNGLTRNLSLKDADIIALAEPPLRAPQRATERAAPRTATPVRQPANPNMEAASDEEVRERMQRVAEEIRRRRALRRDIIEDNSQGSN
ncbi:MAG TPA: hypothetical protein DIV79_16810 [Opitutae bacterium]|nr:hypothetical protein [Opitutaceae bacterium]HCR31666.1 hypothetical protein [Opitutae bacterium]|tara:strand:+ start:1384 stop:1974 length:591 start_codon:yes stop_codon:yes gene_type:complete